MVDRTYLTGKAAPRGAWRLFARQTLLPNVIDAAGALESALAGLAAVARQRPAPALTVALCAGFLAARPGRVRPR